MARDGPLPEISGDEARLPLLRSRLTRLAVANARVRAAWPATDGRAPISARLGASQPLNQPTERTNDRPIIAAQLSGVKIVCEGSKVLNNRDRTTSLNY